MSQFQWSIFLAIFHPGPSMEAFSLPYLSYRFIHGLLTSGQRVHSDCIVKVSVLVGKPALN